MSGNVYSPSYAKTLPYVNALRFEPSTKNGFMHILHALRFYKTDDYENPCRYGFLLSEVFFAIQKELPIYKNKSRNDAINSFRVYEQGNEICVVEVDDLPEKLVTYLGTKNKTLLVASAEGVKSLLAVSHLDTPNLLNQLDTIINTLQEMEGVSASWLDDGIDDESIEVEESDYVQVVDMMSKVSDRMDILSDHVVAKIDRLTSSVERMMVKISDLTEQNDILMEEISELKETCTACCSSSSSCCKSVNRTNEDTTEGQLTTDPVHIVGERRVFCQDEDILVLVAKETAKASEGSPVSEPVVDSTEVKSESEIEQPADLGYIQTPCCKVYPDRLL